MILIVESVLEAIGRRIRDLRRHADLSQEELAQATGLSAKYISELENGHANPSLIVLHTLAENGLKMPLAAFFNYETTGPEVQDDLRAVQALLASQGRTARRRALHVLRALLEPLPK